MENQWRDDVLKVSIAGEVDTALLEAAVINEASQVNMGAQGASVRGGGALGPYLDGFKKHARRALCKDQKLRDEVSLVVESETTTGIISAIAEVIWSDFPPDLKPARYAAIAVAVDTIAAGLDNFCSKGE